MDAVGVAWDAWTATAAMRPAANAWPRALTTLAEAEQRGVATVPVREPQAWLSTTEYG